MSDASIDPQAHTPSGPARIERALGSTETIYYLLDKLYCLNFVVFAEIDGAFDTSRLVEALATVQAEHPLLGARIASVRGRPWFQPLAAAPQPIPVRRLGLRNWRAVLAAQLDEPFDDGGPLARFVWFAGTRKCAAAMVFHHAIGDGRSGADVFIEVLRRAAAEDLPPSWRPARPSAQALDLIKLKGPVSGAMKKLGYWLKQGGSALKFAQQLPGYDMSARTEREIAVLKLSIAPAQARTLLAACRTYGTTMQGALGAALLLAVNAEFEAPRARHLGLNSLADLRGVLSGGLTQRDLGLYVATVTTVHAIDASPTFWSLAADVTRQLRAVLASGDANLVHSVHDPRVPYPPNVAGARLMQALVALAPPSSMLTNVGRFAPVALRNGARLRSLEFLVSPPAHQPFCVTVASLGDGMHLNLLYDRLKIDAAQARRVADAMLARLQG